MAIPVCCSSQFLFPGCQGWTADEYEVGRGKNWFDKYDVGGAADSGIPDDLDDLEDYIEEASSAEKERYRFLLQAALGGGVVQPAEKEKLELYREMHAIPLEEHNALLFEMGWKAEEFELGFHKDIAASHFQQYAALVKKELSKGEVGVLLLVSGVISREREHSSHGHSLRRRILVVLGLDLGRQGGLD